MQKLTDQERESLVPALELCAELGIETGWRHIGYTNTHVKSRDILESEIESKTFRVEDATRYDYRSLCEAIAEFVLARYWVVIKHNSKWYRHDIGFGTRISKNDMFISIDCTDCKLAALTAAAKGVGK